MPSHAEKRQRRIASMDVEILDVDGAATVLGVSRGTIYRLARKGSLPGTRVGREWRFSRKNLIRWVSDRGTTTQLESILKSSSVRVGNR